ncbi:Z1 domain-containing protein [Frankia sp. Mgl5]|uniref:Z1 domain-containing protein n=1 Tax=unclassified Frankia TaxID=2632575 RepID=UPI00200F1831|nr:MULTISPECIES: Z1 domain-containing protein [unclassified Frankia]MCK9893125.1 Z1 domain-containing protein [Frankia sp. AgB32]MCK9928866.1 Z1 domain-containing protein [Frankia sp. Mgl5]
MNPDHRRAMEIALMLLDDEDDVTAYEVEQAVDKALLLVEQANVDVGELRRDVESRCNVWLPTEQVLNGREDHVPWLDAARGEIDWSFWERYRRYLGRKDWAPAQIRSIDQVTDRILGSFEKPDRPGRWDRRGMVVGQVQSGKTANYTGVICKAADAGYRLIVVLAGLHNSLRSQTQHRLDLEFLGFDTRSNRSYDQSNAKVGVGRMPGKFLHVHSLTSSDEKGDFQVKVARQVWLNAGGGDPVILVVKKNASVLRNLHSWATRLNQERDPETGQQIVRDVPLLVIDDEADNASVNTRARPTDENGQPIDDYDPTKINGLIRKLLRTFEKSAYLAYTATPFANVFIDADARTEKYGEDLFPRSFIISLRPPSNYVGVNRVFGLDRDANSGIEGQVGLPIISTFDDHEMWLPNKHGKDTVPGRLPASLLTAINAFLLATAARRVRGHEDHNSMLVHVTRFTDVQALLRRALHEHLGLMRQRLWHGDPTSPDSPWPALESLWRSDFVPTTESLLRNPDVTLEVGGVIDWAQIREALPGVLDDVELRILNGKSEDALTYSEADQPLTLIAIGGDKLSRGLTLEGLTVSYYLRASRMYDTLMQMGRWFGYRPGYLDLCRLYTTDELAGWYRDIALANEELLREFDYMAALGKTPQEYGLRVRAHPDGLMITARTKMRNGTDVDITFSQTISESITFETDEEVLRTNLAATKRLVGVMGTPAPRRGALGTVRWDNVPAADVLDFLDRYQASDVATKAQPRALADYVRTLLTTEQPELTTWTVGLVSVSGDDLRTHRIGEFEVGLVRRALYLPREGANADAEYKAGLRAGKDRYVVRRLVSPSDEGLDLSDEEGGRALEMTRQAWQADPKTRKTAPSAPGGLAIREVRPPGRGLLLLYPLRPDTWMHPDLPPVGFALSFPKSPTAKTIKYRVTNLWWDQEFGSQEFGGEESDEEQA